MTKSFASHTDDDIHQKRLKIIPTTTERANKRAENSLRQYLAEPNDDTEFELFSPERLNDVPKHLSNSANLNEISFTSEYLLINVVFH
jgi:hypothetical protein